MPRVRGGAAELNRLLEAAILAGLADDQAEVVAEKNAWALAEAFGWRKMDGSWRDAEEHASWKGNQKRVDITPNYVRVRVRSPADFTQGTFRIIDLDKRRGIRAVIGRLKGKRTTTRQSILFRRDKGWTARSAEKWVRDHGMTPVGEGGRGWTRER